MTSAFGDLSDDSHVHWVTLSDLSHDSDSKGNGSCTQTPTMALKAPGRGRPAKQSRDYDALGSPSLVDAKLAQNSVRREQRRLRKLSCESRGKGRPVKQTGSAADVQGRAKRRQDYKINKQRRQLEEICAPLGVVPGTAFESILTSISSTRRGRSILPNLASNCHTTTALTTLLQGRTSMKQGLVRGLSQLGASTGDLGRSLKLNVETIKKGKGWNNKLAREAQEHLAKLTRSDARRAKIFPGEMYAVIEHAKEYMYVKSGAGSDIYMLPCSLKSLYVAYRRDFATIQEVMTTQAILEHQHTPSKTASAIYLNNQLLLAKGITDVEPWQEYITSLKLFLGKRRAANLSTKACTNLIVNNGGKMEVVEVKPPELEADAIVDYALLPIELEAKLQRSREKGDQLRPRGYKTWKALLGRNDSFHWKSIYMPYSCETCTGAYAVERQWKDANEAVLAADTRSPEYTKAKSELWGAYQGMSKLEQHQMQLKNQRAFIQTQEKNLPAKTPDLFKIVVYLDFVAQYNFQKKKVANLVFTVKWRDEAGNLQYKYIDNFCSDNTQKSDAMYVKCAWEFHLRPVYLRKQLATFGVLSSATRTLYEEELAAIKATGNRDEFAGVTHIIRTGDNGGHLLNKILMTMESSVFKTYGIDYETHTLSKRHGYNSCDAHGGAVKRTINQFSVSHYDPATAHEFANIVNGWVTGLTADCARHANCRAYAMVNIPRAEKEELKAACRSCTGMQRACEFVYTCKNQKGEVVHEPGIMRVREVSGCNEEEALILDIQKRDTSYGNICKGCTRIKEYPVYHKKDIWTYQKTACKFKAAAGSMLSFKRPGLYPPADKKSFLKVQVVVDLFLQAGESDPQAPPQSSKLRQPLKPTKNVSSSSCTASSLTTAALSSSSSREVKRPEQNRISSGKFTRKNVSSSLSRRLSSSSPTATALPLLSTTAAISSTTCTSHSSSSTGCFAASSSPTAALSSSSSREVELENVTEDVAVKGTEYMIGIKNNTYEEKIAGSGKWVPVYQCKWFGSSETTWHYEDTIPLPLMEYFKGKRKNHYQSEKEFHKKRIEQQSKEQRKAKRDTQKVQPLQDVPILSDYELQRQQNITENHRMLKLLVTDPISMVVASPPKKKLRVTVTTSEMPLPRRQPSRTCKDKTSATASFSSSGSGSSSSSSASETTVSSAQPSSAESEYDSISSDEPLSSYK